MASLKTLLRKNPKASQHEATIRGAISDVKKLREIGVIDCAPKEIPAPYKGVQSFGKIGRPATKKRLITAYKVTF